MTRNRWLRVSTLAAGFLLLTTTVAHARYLGSDLFGNVAPNGGVGGLADRYPLSAYTLDYHVDGPSAGFGGISTGDVPQMISQWLTSQIWAVLVWILKLVIDLFAWAFTLDLINGQHGALTPVGDAVRGIYQGVFGNTWVVAAITLAGIVAIWTGLAQRRYSETFASLAVSVACVVIALTLIFDPVGTIGLAAHWSRDMSGSFLAATNQGDVTDPASAKRQVSDHLWTTLVYRPWVVLEFGGLKHCVDTDRHDDHGYPLPVAPNDPARDICRDHVRRDNTGHGGYAARFLAQPVGSDARDKEYEVLRDGELPTPATPQFANGYIVDKTDSPAVDVQQAGGAYQRLALVVLIAVGAIGPVIVIGFFACAIVLAQVLALVIFGFAAVMALVGWIPGIGHDAFRAWLGKLGVALFINAIYSLGLGIVLVVSAALTSATATLGFLWAFALQTAYFWALLIYHKQITARRRWAATGGRHDRLPPQLRRAIEKPVRTLTHMAVPVPIPGRRPDPTPTTATKPAGTDTSTTTAATGPNSAQDPTVVVVHHNGQPTAPATPDRTPTPPTRPPSEHPPVRSPASPRAFPPYQPPPSPEPEKEPQP
jgi:type II secretory pathway pseudopilin PulG